MDVTSGTKKKKRRSKKGRASRRAELMGDQATAFTPRLTPVVAGATDTGLRRLRLAPRDRLSDHGVAFLKCAFAPPDFQAVSIGGVPDDFRGMSLVRKHRFVAPLNLTAATDYYLLLLPTPGIAYWQATTVAGVAPVAATVWTGVNYSDYASMFGTANTTVCDQVTKYRFVSNHIELIPTVNQMVWSGNIQCWKMPVAIATRLGGANFNDEFNISGLNAVNSTLSNQFSGPFITGVYSGCYNSNSSFIFQNLQEGITGLPNTLGAADFGTLTSTIALTGLDPEFESLLIKITGITANETALIKTWSCVEYQASANSALYEFQSLSPCDKMALELYREIITGLPVGVPYDQNDTFWTRVLGIIHQLTGMGSVLPGPYGAASRGVNLLSGAALHFLS
jgi:hypothetical protein